jgi:hypothetical protein
VKQIHEGARFNDVTRVKHQDPVGVAQRLKSVRHQNDRTIGARVIDGFLHVTFVDRVQGGGALVENQNRGILEKNTRQSRMALPCLS